MPRILLAEPLSPEAEERLERAGELVRAPDAQPETLRRLAAECDALVARTRTRIDAALLDAAPRLRLIGVAGVGLDQVDLDATRARGVEVVNTPAAASDAVAELAVDLMLALRRPVQRLASAYRRGEFHAARRHPHGSELRSATIGIVGMGRIGSRVGRICSAGFGARVLYHDIIPVGPFSFAAEAVDTDALWRSCDIVTLHVPLTPDTRRMADAAALGRMKPDAAIVNTARGEVLDTDALLQALESGRLAGAALDVTDPEPLPPDHRLFQLDNCVLTPHIAARTHEGLRNMLAVVDVVAARIAARDAPA